jgi:hypothetical protein
MDRPRKELMDHVAAHDNLCLLTSRQQATFGFRHVFVAQEVANDCVISTTSREANQVFPLYLYPDQNELTGISEGQRRPNLSDDFTKELAARLTLHFIPEGK